MSAAQVESLADWAVSLEPSPSDDTLADRSLVDTAAVAFAARNSEIVPFANALGRAGGLAALSHFLDFDDLHIPSTAHISTVCVPATVVGDGDSKAFLAGAGVMARIGTALGWTHYTRGWHATCTAGAPAAAVSTAVANRLSPEETAHALVLALPSAGGFQAVFGTHGKALQVGFAVAAGVRAAELASLGARTDLGSFGRWLDLLGGDIGQLDIDGPTIPGGLAIKSFPCCYALQRPMQAVSLLTQQGVDVGHITAISVLTPRSALRPLIHDKPSSGLEAKFSLPYGIAAALVDSPGIGFDTFTDAATRRQDVETLRKLVQVEITKDGSGLLDGETVVTLGLRSGDSNTVALDLPPGAPGAPLSHDQLRRKVKICSPDFADEIMALTWKTAGSTLRPLLEQ